jgi:hypothetical protein
MRRYAAVTDQTLRAAAEAVSGAEGHRPSAVVFPQDVQNQYTNDRAAGDASHDAPLRQHSKAAGLPPVTQ